MTGHDTPPGIRLMTDGGQPEAQAVKSRTVVAKGVTEREIDGEQREVLRVPISSTRPDRENDRFDKQALDGMADQIRAEQPHVFDNHGLAGGWMDAIPYDSRETIGTQFDAELAEADDGEFDLFAFVNPDGTHAEGERMLKQVRDEKQAIKFSVGFGIGDEEPIEDEAGNQVGRRFLNADLMETSRVGIPANPDASLSTATAKGGVAPGFAMHPLFARMMGLDEAAVKGPIDSETVREGTPVRVDGGEDPPTEVDRASAEEVASLRGDVNALREEIAALKDGDGDGEEGKGPCDDNGDCPEGEVCVDGECVPEDEVDDDDDDDEEEDSASATTEELESLQAELDNLREELKDGRGDPQTKDTATEEPDLTETGAPDATDDADEPDETDDGPGYITQR